jgi:phosphoesterase RecJ-like protein
VTLNGVKLNRDHSVAEVFYSVMGDDEDRKKSFQGLKKAKGFMQSKLVRTLGLRQAPDLRFFYDDSVEKGLEMDNLLNDLAAQGEFLTEDEKLRQMTLDDLQPPPELIRALREAKSLWIVPHFNPDPDAIGSALALAEGLRLTGRLVRVMGYADPPVNLTDMPGFAQVTPSEEAEEIFANEKPDTCVLVDCHRIDRTGPLEGTLERFDKRLCIDHHLISGRRAPESGWVEARASSSCTLVHQVLGVLGEGDAAYDDGPFELSLDMATNLYAGLVTDTGGFRFNNTRPFTFEFARELSARGVDTAHVASRTLHRYRREGVDLMQRALATFEYHRNGRILTLHVDRKMLADSGGSLGDTEGFVNIATSVDGVEMVAFLKESADNTWRVSLRVSEDGDVQQVAAKYGGGGHKMAAGCTIEGTLEDVRKMLVADLTSALAG